MNPGEPSPGAARAVPVLLNVRARARSRLFQPRLDTVLRDAGLEPDIQPLQPSELAERLRALQGAPLVAVAGGDGSLGTAAGALLGTETTLAPLPAGRLNHFARRLDLGTLPAAARAAAAGRIRSIPLGMFGDRPFLNTAVVGAYHQVVRLRERLRPMLTIWPAALVAYAVTMIRWPAVDLVIRTPGGEIRRRTIVAWIGSGPGTFPAPHQVPLARPGDSVELVLPRAAGRRAAWALTRSLLRHRFGPGDPADHGLEVLRPTSIEIDGDGPIPVTLDGEPTTFDPPVTVTLRADALRVIAPPI